MPLARRWLRYRRCYGGQRMTPARRAFHECRMQFPRHRVSPRNRIVGITTFVDTVESSPNRIACETAPSASCLRSSPRTWTRSFARGPSNPRGGLMACAAAPPRRISRGWRACHGVNAHCQRFMCERRTRWRRCAHNADHLARNTPLSTFVIEVVCDLGATLPRGVTSPPACGGNCASRGPVRDLPAGDIVTKRGELHH